MNLVTLVNSIPSPSTGVLEVGPIPLRAYAFAIIIGALVAVWIGEKRWTARGGRPGLVGDVAIWAIPAGIIGARIYHVVTDYQLYFGEGRRPVEALFIWQGGLGIWGAVSGGALGAYLACRHYNVGLAGFGDAIAPGILVAQGIGRWGNYFNQELFGQPTDLPWALEIDPENRPAGFVQFETFHPTFLYESLWCFGAALLIIAIDRKYDLSGNGRIFALYIVFYTAGRLWIELLRIDPANDIGPFRVNVWMSMLVFAGALAYFILRKPKRDKDQSAVVM